MWFSSKPRGVDDLGASCCECGASEGQKLITREERVGCIVSPFTYCQPCSTKIMQERKAVEYQRLHFCNSCDVKFEKPLRKNRRNLEISQGFHPYSMNLCLKCYEIEVARLPEARIGEVVFTENVEANPGLNPWL